MPRPRRRSVVIGVGIGVTVLAGILRLVGLGSPGEIYFDETYYANDARLYVRGVSAYDFPLDYNAATPPGQPPPDEGRLGERSWVHPPLGKWLIAAGMLVFGPESAWGRRIVPALFGTATVLVVFLIGLELTTGVRGAAAKPGPASSRARAALPGADLRTLDSRRTDRSPDGSPAWAGLAAGLVALDGLHIVESRISTLDAIVTAFICIGVLGMLRHRQTVERDAPADVCPPDQAGDGDVPGVRAAVPCHGSRWLLVSGGAFACGLATKWSAALPFIACVVFTAVWSVRARRFAREWGGLVVAFVALPAVIYTAAFSGYFAEKGTSPAAFVDYQTRMLDAQRGISAEHPYKSSALSWPLLKRPVAYYYTASGDDVRHIVALGNPGLWWLSIPALAWLAGVGLWREGWPGRIVLVLALIQWLPWIWVGRTLFLYYMTPVVPFLGLAVALAACSLPRGAREGAGILAGAASVAGAAFLLPVWLGISISQSYWQQLMLFRSWI